MERASIRNSIPVVREVLLWEVLVSERQFQLLEKHCYGKD